MVPLVNELTHQKLRTDIGVTFVVAIILYALISDPLQSLLDLWIARYPDQKLLINAVNPVGFTAIWGVVHYLYTRHLWKLIPMGGQGVPRIAGTWSGTLTRDIDNKEFDIKVEIAQMLDGISFKFASGGDFTSDVTLATFDRDSAQNARIKYLYCCRKQGRRHHYGTTVLLFTSKTSADGFYYTDKPTTEPSRKKNGDSNYAGYGRIALRKETKK
jgi:hypothetical protein